MMTNPATHFIASGNQLNLVSYVPSKVPFSKPKMQLVPFADWPIERPPSASAALARLLRALEDNEIGDDGAPFIVPDGSGVSLHQDLVASLTDSEALALDLPPATTLALQLQSSGLIQRAGFRIDFSWIRKGGVPVRTTLEAGSLVFNSKKWRIPEPLHSVLRCVEKVNNASDEALRQIALAELKTAIGEEAGARIRSDGVIERLRIAYASAFSLDLRDTVNGPDFDPVLFSRERLQLAVEGNELDQDSDSLLPPTLAQGFARRFRAGSGARRSYLLDDGSLLFLDPQVARALEEVRLVQSAPAEQRRAFAASPQRHLSAALSSSSVEVGDDNSAVDFGRFIETKQFSERVAGVDIWRKPVLPWIKPKADSWLPEAFGLRVGEPPEAQMITLSYEMVPDALDAIQSALSEKRPHFAIDGQNLPATQATLVALQSLDALVSASPIDNPELPGQPPESLRQRYFLQVRDNLEDVSFAPLGQNATAQDVLLPETMPSGIRTAAKAHQIAGLRWLAENWLVGRPGAVLADDMGLGKTFQALAFVVWLRSRPGTHAPILIVAPSGLLDNWEAEIRRHIEPDGLGRIVRAAGAELARIRKEAGRDIENGDAVLMEGAWSSAGIVLTTYETMRDYHMSFARQHFAAIFYDEAQKLKNPASQLTRAAKALNAKFQLALTGTPVENRLQDLWSIVDVVHPGLLGSSKQFEEQYPAKSHALRDLHQFLTSNKDGQPPVLLRRMKEQCLDSLPAKRIVTMPVSMPIKQALAYEQVVMRALALKGTGERGGMLEVLHSLRGVSLHPTRPEDAGKHDNYLADSARVAATIGILKDISAKGEKALVFCESLAMQALLADELRRQFDLPHAVLRIHGALPSTARQAAVEVFQTRGPGFDVMILSPKSGGVGLTLTAANHVIHLSRWWNPAVEDQATDRVYRIGQTKEVTVYLPQAIHPDEMLGPTSFDLRLHALMERKRELGQGLLAPGEDEADADSLFDLVVTDAVEALPPKKPPAERIEQPAIADHPVSSPQKSIRKILGIAKVAKSESAPASHPIATPRAYSLATWPRRVVYEEGGPRDRTIFTAPIADDPIRELVIVDPYGAAGDRARRMTADFARVLIGDGRGAEPVKLVTFDAESVSLTEPETSDSQYTGMHECWRRHFGENTGLQFMQLSKRGNRQLHDREVRATTRSGRRLVWDIGRGIEGVMTARFRCTVVFTEE